MVDKLYGFYPAIDIMATELSHIHVGLQKF